ncbi:hypothetical protein L0668_05660 [Paraglaciecola aquimarina]|uniref:Uncharacterized protein n=2 Tax=Paraglaciecola algarum TaxID=3050085 RepID=A0ABS9D3X4_9ALTE|nr:hypothetical protein [Paraglaciecola sp. G1-23]
MAFYYYEVHRYDEKCKTYEGAFVNGFEYVMFVSCVEIEEIDNTVKDKYTTDIYVDGIAGFSERYSKYFLNEY